MRLLFSLFLVSVSVLSAPLDEVQETGVVRPDRQEGEDVPADCCIPRYTSCTWHTLVHCYHGEWVRSESKNSCFWGFKWYKCCGRCECTWSQGECHVSKMPEQSFFYPPGE